MIILLPASGNTVYYNVDTIFCFRSLLSAPAKRLGLRENSITRRRALHVLHARSTSAVILNIRVDNLPAYSVIQKKTSTHAYEQGSTFYTGCHGYFQKRSVFRFDGFVISSWQNVENNFTTYTFCSTSRFPTNNCNLRVHGSKQLTKTK